MVFTRSILAAGPAHAAVTPLHANIGVIACPGQKHLAWICMGLECTGGGASQYLWSPNGAGLLLGGSAPTNGGASLHQGSGRPRRAVLICWWLRWARPGIVSREWVKPWRLLWWMLGHQPH